MSVSRLPLCLVLILASSALATYPFAYPDLRSAPLSFGPHLIYGSGISGGNADLTGFSYSTKDFGGGESEVVFFTGPNSNIKMTEEVAAMKDQMSAWPATTAVLKSDKSDDSEVKSDSTENQDASGIPALGPVAETKETSISENQAEAISTTAQPMAEDKKDSDEIFQGIFNGQLFPAEKGAGFDSPYPILRLGGSALYYPQLPTAFSGFAGYGPSDYFRSQYVPVVNNYNAYQSLYNPHYSPLDKNYYNPGIYPTIYQSPIVSPSSVNSLASDKTEDGSTENPLPAIMVNARIGEEADKSDDKKTEAVDSSSTTEKATESPATTEQMVEKSTTISEIQSTTTEEIKETSTASSTTTVVNDPVAVE